MNLESIAGVLEQQVAAMPPTAAKRYISVLERAVATGDWSEVKHFALLKRQPVDMRTFLTDPYYLGQKGEQVWDAVLDELEELNSGRYVEAVLTGGIGSAKTFSAVNTTIYQIYLLSCYEQPQLLLDQASSDEIVFIVQSITETLAKKLDYARIKARIEISPYFQEKFPFDKNIESELRFPNRIVLRPVSGTDTAVIGQNVIGGIIDEINYMSVVENSKSSVDGGTYDQAVAIYNSLSRRRKTRFLQQGKLPGILCLVSSRKYPGQFTDRKEEEAKTDPTIFIYDKRAWEVQPKSKYCGEMFRIFVGDQSRKPRILNDGEKVADSDNDLVMDIPVEYKDEFETDIINALREIAGVSTLARHPFMLNTEAVSASFKKDMESVLSHERVDFSEIKLSVLKKKIKDPHHLRYAHVDLGLTSDSAGVACGYVSEFREISRGDFTEILPVIHYDFILEVAPPKGGEILFYKIRDLFYKLRELGIPIKWVSYDSYQSVDSIQLLRQKGFLSGQISMDTSRTPYEMLKQGMYDGRVYAPLHALAKKECLSLESDPKTGKLDHPPNGSKDCSDAMAGVAYGLMTRKEIWSKHSIPPGRIPESVMTAGTKIGAEKGDKGDA